MDKCRTCGRPRGHVPDKYNQRLNEIKQWKMPQDYDYGDGSSWTDSWGLIVGLILLMCIIGLLAWAFYEDQKDAVHDGTEL